MMRPMYRCLLALHPAMFRDRFAEEMLWIFDESQGRWPRKLFVDGVVSLFRQWLLRSNIWKIGVATAVCSVLLFAWSQGQESSLDAAFSRGDPGALEAAAASRIQQTAAQTAARTPDPVKAVQGIVDAFRDHPLVMVGEAHWMQQAGNFYVQLVRDPAFQEAVQDIVVEFASRNNQPLLDRYIAGEDIPMEDVRHIWRDTTKVASWESPIYAEWLAAIREVNKGLPANRRLRVLAGDTAIDWSQIRTHAEWAALGDNNISFADVIVNRVLAKKHRALVVLGSNHVAKNGGRDADNARTRVESRYPGSTFIVQTNFPGLLDSASQALLSSPGRNTPVLYKLVGTSLGEAADRNGTPLSAKADALLYLGPPETSLALPPAGSLESTYLKEVDRRSMIEWGELRPRKFLGPAAQ